MGLSFEMYTHESNGLIPREVSTNYKTISFRQLDTTLRLNTIIQIIEETLATAVLNIWFESTLRLQNVQLLYTKSNTALQDTIYIIIDSNKEDIVAKLISSPLFNQHLRIMLTHLPGTDSINYCFSALVQNIITHPQHKHCEAIKKAIEYHRLSHSANVQQHSYEYTDKGTRSFKKYVTDITHKKSSEVWKDDSDSLHLSKNRILDIINSVGALESTTEGLIKSQSDLQAQLTEQRQIAKDLEKRLIESQEIVNAQASKIIKITELQSEESVRIANRLAAITQENLESRQSDQDLWKVVNALVTKHTPASNHV